MRSPFPTDACRAACLAALIAAGCSGGPEEPAGLSPGAATPPPGPAGRTESPAARAAPPRAARAPGPAERAHPPPDAPREAPVEDLPEPPPQAPVPPEPPRSPPRPPRAASRNAEVMQYVFRLESTREAAGEAFRDLWEAPREIIPALILEAGNPRPSGLGELTILVLDRKRFLSVDEEGNVLYDIPGLRGVKYDDIVSGNAPRGLKVVLRRFKEPFTVGEAIRAALINRFRSADAPPGDDAANPVRWWQEFHARVKGRL